ncbi:hypothetical protein CC80DRAFT_513935 [Byssothecium circinans]|uniref:GH16 domain-containing protein n=1 Tax=Byssothecium circinans TaxID=147558 RepID=A0A6A5U7P1_9PLEO|nr:hypothetical protein CC80DRAFT_513935 [Byssothecium circinans]
MDNCAGSSFLSCFNFFSQPDPTHGFVRYFNQANATAQNLFSISSDNTVTIAVDSKNVAPGGRPSVRLQSKKVYNRGLFAPGTWPSFWSWGSSATWPEHGEIDIIEGIHTSTTNAMSLHTSDGCTINGSASRGKVVTKNCFIGAPGQTSNAGCGIESFSAKSFGSPLNDGGGGVWAVEWTEARIGVWFFPRGEVPEGLKGGSPDPAAWGAPDANFQGDCDLGKHFIDQRFVIDTTFCGDWAGALWGSHPTCSKLAPSCADYVANNPSAFTESFWKINSFKTFRQG